MEIDSSSCRLAGTLLCTHLLKTLFTLYNTEPIIIPEEKSSTIKSISSKFIFSLIFHKQLLFNSSFKYKYYS